VCCVRSVCIKKYLVNLYLDFGLSKESIDEDKKTFSFCGTVEYMAPEVSLLNTYSIYTMFIIMYAS